PAEGEALEASLGVARRRRAADADEAEGRQDAPRGEVRQEVADRGEQASARAVLDDVTDELAADHVVDQVWPDLSVGQGEPTGCEQQIGGETRALRAAQPRRRARPTVP